ncbi:MAG: hypothetical protein H8D87_06450 [Deltaproteobacteria bacterium]|nr:hypothetical protein [Candidatus Desulfobacula maris]
MAISERKKVKALKKHECHYCHKAIPPGGYYIKFKFLDVDIFKGYKMHDVCETKFLGKLSRIESLDDYHEQTQNF